MCKREIYMLSVTNRGTNVIADTSDPNTFAVNVPANLRKNKECMITIQSGTIAYPLTEARDLLELGISTDLPILGYDTEVTSGFMSRNFNKLFSVNLPNISDSYPQYPEIGPLSSVGSNGAANNMGGATLVRIFNQSDSNGSTITIGVNTFKITALESIIVRKTAAETVGGSTNNVFCNPVQDDYNWVGTLDNTYQCRCGSLPEKFRFTRVANTTNNTVITNESVPSTNAPYISFTLIIEYLNDMDKE